VTITLDDVRAAAERIAGQADATPLVRVPTLAKLTGVDVRYKLESLQPTGAFKVRGALNKLSQLDAAQRAAGVICCSAGNHALAVAAHAEQLGLPATIVMPVPTPFTKVERTRRYGAEVVLYGATLADANERADAFAAERGLTFVHPYDDPLVIAGQGTIGLEMLAAAPELDVLVVPIGGGGLISGIATVAKALKPEIEIVGVEAARYPSMSEALAGESPTSGGLTIAEGIAVKTPGRLTLPIVRELIDDIVVLDEPALETAVHTLAETGNLIAEGAGAAGFGAILADPARFQGRIVGTVICGGNIDARLLTSVLLRGLARSGRLIRLRVEIADQPGALGTLTGLIGEAGGNIVDLSHRRMFFDVPTKQTHVDVIVETRNAEHGAELAARLKAAGFPTLRLSDRSLDGTVGD